MRKIIILLVCVFAAFLLSSCALFPEEEALLEPPLLELNKSVQYDTAPAVRGDIAETVTVSGVLASCREETLCFEQDDLRMDAFHVKPGDFVAAGELIATAISGDLPSKTEMQRNRVEIARLRAQSETGTAREIALLEMANEQLALDALEDSLNHTRLYAKNDGVVLFLNATDRGAPIAAYTVMARLADPTALAAYAQSSSLRSVTVGIPATITINGKEHSGQVIQAPQNALQVNDTRMQDAVLVRVDDLPEGAAMGDALSIHIVLKSKRDVLLVPRNAVRTVVGNTYVYVLEDGTRKEYAVTTGISSGGQIEILTGLSEGMEVILQ